MTDYRNSTNTSSTNIRQAAQAQSATAGSNTATRARVREEQESRAAMMHGQYVDCCRYFAQSFHRGVAPGIQRAFAERIREGMSADVIRAAIDETMRAPRPSWAYCEAILRNLDLDQVKTIDQWNERKRRHENASNPALNYSQREWTDDMFGEDFFINLSEYAT